MTYDVENPDNEELNNLLKRIHQLEAALKPFADKATKWEANHMYAARYGGVRDGQQIEHRLGDFRNARNILEGSQE
jgi:hypothetical protein